jgi:hypothetical protein
VEERVKHFFCVSISKVMCQLLPPFPTRFEIFLIFLGGKYTTWDIQRVVENNKNISTLTHESPQSNYRKHSTGCLVLSRNSNHILKGSWYMKCRTDYVRQKFSCCK